MDADQLKGKSLRWTYSDGPMQGKHFEHRFGEDGRVSWKEAKDAQPTADSYAKYQFARINDAVYAVSYLSDHGYTLTTIVDERSGSIVSFASNEKELVIQHGTLEQKDRVA